VAFHATAHPHSAVRRPCFQSDPVIEYCAKAPLHKVRYSTLVLPWRPHLPPNRISRSPYNPFQKRAAPVARNAASCRTWEMDFMLNLNEMMQSEIDASQLLSHFEKDNPRRREMLPHVDLVNGQIEGCTASSLLPMSDHRGDLIEMLTARDHAIKAIVHVYQVFCEPGSIRAWIYHAKQTDRLCYTNGVFRIALFDLRLESPTCGNLVTLLAGTDGPTLLQIPPFVAHGVQNLGSDRASFVNMPTNIYRLEDPDKYRLPFDSPLIPFTW
jgi:dTDP-4-dehydrorhamnose 3,5-epimerase